MSNYDKLNPKNAFIWRIVHRDNVPWLLDNGLHCATSKKKAPDYVAIGNPDLIDNRSRREIPISPGGTLSDYVPFYFTPFSPMMYNIYTGRGAVPRRHNDEICILVSSLHKIREAGLPFVFTDRHAYLQTARFFSDISDLDKVDWPLLQARNFQRNTEDLEQIERYQAEALIFGNVPVELMKGLVCHSELVRDKLQDAVTARGLTIAVQALPRWFFQ